MIKITEFTHLAIGDKVYVPQLNLYFQIANYSYNNSFKVMLADLISTPENPNENGFTATLPTIIDLDYQKC